LNTRYHLQMHCWHRSASYYLLNWKFAYDFHVAVPSSKVQSKTILALPRFVFDVLCAPQLRLTVLAVPRAMFRLKQFQHHNARCQGRLPLFSVVGAPQIGGCGAEIESIARGTAFRMCTSSTSLGAGTGSAVILRGTECRIFIRVLRSCGGANTT